MVTLAALALSPASAKEHTHATHLTRVMIEPGVTLALSSNWYGCDRELNAQLHDRPLPDAIAENVCKPLHSASAIHLQNLLVRSPVSLIVDHYDMQAESVEALSQATPEMVAYIDAFSCGHMGEILGMDQTLIASCSTSITTVSGHVGEMSRVVYSAHGDAHELKIFHIPYDQGDLQLQFERSLSQPAAAEEIDAVLAGIQIEPGDSPVQMIPLNPAPGISLSIPHGWEACDDATNVSLGDDPDWLGARQKSCARVGTNPEIKLSAFNPQPLQNVSVGVTYSTDKDLTESEIAGFSADRLTDMTPRVCQSVTQPLKNDLSPVDSCVLSVEQIGGHTALLVTVVAAFSYDSDTERSRAHIYFVPYEEGYASIEFIVPIIGEAVSQPLVDAIMKTVVIGKADKS
jgi:hypothetical protein